MPIELAYWNFRCLVGACKLLLEYVEAEWTDRQYERFQNPDGTWDRSMWLQVKESQSFQKDFAFPNLPYLTDGDVHLTQSTTILKYIARKYKVGQKLTDTESWRVDLGCDQITNVRDMFINFCYGVNPAIDFPFDQKDLFCNDHLRPSLESLDRFMSGVQFVAGETITFVDFMFWEMLDQMELFDSRLFDGLDNIKSYKARFAAVPKVKAYITSDRFMTAPCNGKRAKWGGDKELTCTWKSMVQ